MSDSNGATQEPVRQTVGTTREEARAAMSIITGTCVGLVNHLLGHVAKQFEEKNVCIIVFTNSRRQAAAILEQLKKRVPEECAIRYNYQNFWIDGGLSDQSDQRIKFIILQSTPSNRTGVEANMIILQDEILDDEMLDKVVIPTMEIGFTIFTRWTRIE
jgi:Lhr-like helicase